MIDNGPARAEILAGMNDLIQHRAYELDTCTLTGQRVGLAALTIFGGKSRMSTRIERIAELLAHDLDDDTWPSSEYEAVAAKALAIADDRQFVVVLDIARQIGRGRETVRSWADRGTWEFPAPAGTLNSSGAGPTRFWDAEVITAWIAEHPGLQGREGLS